MEMRYNVTIQSNVLTAASPVFMEIALVKSAQVWGDTSTAVIGPSSFPPNVWVQGGVSTWNRPAGLNKFNGDAVRILKYKMKRFYPTPNASTTAGSITNYTMYAGKIKFPFKGKKVFAQNPFQQLTSLNHGGILRDKQYYLLVRLESAVASGSIYNIGVTYDTSIYFKDI